jgi:hypothetical protein
VPVLFVGLIFWLYIKKSKTYAKSLETIKEDNISVIINSALLLKWRKKSA